MENTEIMIWVNRAGLLLDLFAFWLMIPELLGPKARSAFVLPSLAIIDFLLSFISVIANMLPVWYGMIVLIFLGIIISSLFSQIINGEISINKINRAAEIRGFIIVLSLLSVILIYNTTHRIYGKMMKQRDTFHANIEAPLVSVKIGMILFSLGFLLQLIATF